MPADRLSVGNQPHRRGRWTLRAAGALALVLLAAPVASAVAGLLGDALRGSREGTLRVSTTGNKSELLKTVPIGRRPGDQKRIVMSLQPGALGDLRDGDRVEATAEVEVSVCLKPNELHGSNRPCIGRTYGYNPTVIAELVLGTGEAMGGEGSSISLARESLTCTQSQPARNHHCVLVLDDGSVRVPEASRLPCRENCHVNLVLSAHDRRARGGDKLVVGSDSGGRSVNGDKGRVNAVRYRPDEQKRVEPIVAEGRVHPTLPISPEGGSPKERAIYSVELRNLRHGEQLVIDGKVVAKIGMHPYNVFQTTGLILSKRRDSASREGWPGKVGDLDGQIAEANGFNCTQGDSAHENPCVARKVGVLEIMRNSPKTLHVNLTVGMAAQLFGEKWRPGDRAKILEEGYLRVYRYPPDRNDSPPPVRD